MKTEKTKKDKSIRPSVATVTIFLVIVAILISIPLLQHRQFLKFVSDFSRVTTRTETKNVVYCNYEGEDILLNQEQKVDIYRKIVFSELKRRAEPSEEMAESGMTVTYGILATLTLAPAEYKGEEALYVEYHSENMDYTYLAPHLSYSVFEKIIKGL
ncbi:MAG: hypothetical protein IKW92_06415 [Firmicutes bacterium]|nr:hypothetical protein [Bacillota bacterium]